MIFLKKTSWFTTITTLFIVVIIFLAAAACGKHDEDGLILFAEVENASKYSDVVEVKLMMNVREYGPNIELARGVWKDGGFIMMFPKKMYPNYLHALVDKNKLQPTITDISSTMFISNKKVKIWNAQFWGLDQDGNVVTRFFPFELDKDGIAKAVFYTYSDSYVTISGHTERAGDMITEFHNEKFIHSDPHPIWFDKITTNYSVNWKRGWNVWSYSRFVNTSVATEKWSSTPFIEVKWYGSEDFWDINRIF